MSEFYEGYWQSDALAHYGIKGQKHGVRNYQNEDGSLTAAGRDRYGVGDGRRERYTQIAEKGSKKGSANGEQAEAQAKNSSKLKAFYNKHQKEIKIAAGALIATAATVAVAKAVGSYRDNKRAKAFFEQVGIQHQKMEAEWDKSLQKTRERVFGKGESKGHSFGGGTKSSSSSVGSRFGGESKSSSSQRHKEYEGPGYSPDGLRFTYRGEDGKNYSGYMSREMAEYYNRIGKKPWEII